jgi:ABC-type glycerol-3-phosphate transport system permease component
MAGAGPNLRTPASDIHASIRRHSHSGLSALDQPSSRQYELAAGAPALVRLGCLLHISAAAVLPRELDEAAILDGANPLQVLWHVILPLSRPALATVAILSGLASWNDFLDPLVYLNDSDKYTLALGLSEFTGLYSSQWHLLMAAATVIIMPVAVLFFFAQRYFVEGVSLTGSKG